MLVGFVSAESQQELWDYLLKNSDSLLNFSEGQLCTKQPEYSDMTSKAVSNLSVIFSKDDLPWLLVTTFPLSGVPFLGCAHGMWKFLGQGENPYHSSDPSHCNDNASSLTSYTTRNSIPSFFFFLLLEFYHSLGPVVIASLWNAPWLLQMREPSSSWATDPQWRSPHSLLSPRHR